MFAIPAGMLKKKGSSIPNVAFQRWILQSPATVPAARCAADMAFYPGLGVIMTGGTIQPGGGGGISDPHNGAQPNAGGTWVWTGSDWYKLAVATDTRRGFTGGMVYDSDANILVRSVPYDSGGLAEWSEFDGTTWTNFTGAPQSAQIWCKIAYDKVRQRTFLHGAWSGGGTWDYNSTTNLWSNSAIGGGTAGYGFGACFDEVEGKVLSTNSVNGYRAQYFSGTAWSSAGWPANPGIDDTTYGEAVWHPVRQTVIVKTYNETWEWNPTTDVLSQLSLTNQGPAFNANAGYIAMAFDYVNGVMVMFGGQAGGMINQTWVSGPL